MSTGNKRDTDLVCKTPKRPARLVNRCRASDRKRSGEAREALTDVGSIFFAQRSCCPARKKLLLSSSKPATTMAAPDSQDSQRTIQDDLRSVKFNQENAAVPVDGAVTANDLLLAAYDPTRLHPLAQLGDQLDYLVLDDAKKNELPGAGTAIPSRGFSDDLCYGTGTMYLSGLALGGLWGVSEGARRPLAVSNMRLRINSILNSVTRRGTFIGNSAGVLALVYNGINSSIDSFRGKHDTAGSMAAGALTGALYKSTAGAKPALVAATLISGLAGIWSYVKKSV